MELLKIYAFGFILATTMGEKEVLDSNTDEATQQLTGKLWLEVKKRLQDYGLNEDDLKMLDDELTPKCSVNVFNGTIIRTKDSRSNGALFLESPTVDTRDECQIQCCSRENCNLAVYKETVSSYLQKLKCFHVY